MIKHSQKLFKVGNEWDLDKEDGTRWDPERAIKMTR